MCTTSEAVTDLCLDWKLFVLIPDEPTSEFAIIYIRVLQGKFLFLFVMVIDLIQPTTFFPPGIHGHCCCRMEASSEPVETWSTWDDGFWWNDLVLYATSMAFNQSAAKDTLKITLFRSTIGTEFAFGLEVVSMTAWDASYSWLLRAVVGVHYSKTLSSSQVFSRAYLQRSCARSALRNAKKHRLMLSGHWGCMHLAHWCSPLSPASDKETWTQIFLNFAFSLLETASA